MQGKNLAGLLLGCTHYGIIGENIRRFLGESLPLVAASESAAEDAADYIEREKMQGGSGRLRLFTSGNADEFYAFASAFLGTSDFELEALPPMEVENA